MAEPGKSVTAGKLAINVQKRLSRAQEKVLQKLGKADETRDVVFEEMVAKFNKQMSEGTKLHKDLKAYMAAVKTMHDASRRLQDCLADMYDPEWFGKEEMDTLVEDTDTLWLDYHQNINDKSLNTLDTYVTQFPDIKARIAKRDRKMVDFDSARHHFASLQKGKKKDEAKIAKPAALLEMAAPSWAQGLISAHQVAQTNLSYNQAEEDLGRAQKIFEELNVELQDELPSLWDNRVGIYVTTFQALAGHQEKFHKEMSKLSQNLNDIMTNLEEQRQLNKESNHSESASSAPKRPGPPPSRPELTPSPDQSHNPFGGQNTGSDANTEITTTAPQAPSLGEQNPEEQQQQQYDSDQYPEEARGGWDYSEGNTHDYSHPSWDDAQTAQDNWDAAHSYSEPSWDIGGTQVGQGGWADDEEAQGVVASGSDPELPPGFIYKVKAIHDYTPTDNDEMELKMGDVVLALAFDNPDEQDDGWLLGVKESHWVQHKDISVKGVFPENFTQKV
ncbi:myc box-dependent-interacting protein 1b isoform X2 [Takifugu flavidus]|uniref:myc box-dependent-interacting protein 1b isoform X2 n=1 Tax=Takifugu flavidus TaxID=433684 RepID=UPI00254469DD|nr:myc box-dependent-interacting protein 1b isoform X2 [Takifugu flavidus]